MCQSTVKLEHNSMRENVHKICQQNKSMFKKKTQENRPKKHKKKTKVSNCEIYL